MGEQADRAVTLLVRNFFVINAIWALPLGSIEWLLSNVRALRATFDTGIACLIALLLLWWLSSFLIRPIFLILTEANEGRRYSLRAVAAESRKVWLKQLVTLASLTALRLVLVVGAYILAAYCATFALAIYRNEVAQSLPYAAQVVIVTALVLACIAIIVAYIPLNYAEAIAFGVCIFERPDVFSAIGKGLRQTFAGRNLRHAFVAGLAVFAIEMGSWAIQYGNPLPWHYRYPGLAPSASRRVLRTWSGVAVGFDVRPLQQESGRT